MTKATARITLNVTPEQRTAALEAADGEALSELGKRLLADFCRQRGVEFPDSPNRNGGRRPGPGRKPASDKSPSPKRACRQGGRHALFNSTFSFVPNWDEPALQMLYPPRATFGEIRSRK